METIIRRIFVACFIAIMCVSSIEAQVIDLSEKQNDDQTIGKEEEEKRETHLNDVLPEVVLYTSNGTIGINSPYVTFESVIYYIMDANGIIVATDEIILPKNVEQTIDISLLPAGVYRILLEICGKCFIGEFIKND
ncbi:MAG: hypothetical protein IJY78_04305 [Bacteroidaceae bacterium]|nr:hypothetical protein [Bacteroidaceae bacterium]